MEIPGTVFGSPEVTNRISLINNDEGQKTAKHTPRRLIATPIGGFGEVLNTTTGGNEKQGEHTKSLENLIEKSITKASQEILVRSLDPSSEIPRFWRRKRQQFMLKFMR